jgi:urea carboxylase
MIYSPPRITALGDCYVSVEFGDSAGFAINIRTLDVTRQIRELAIPGVVEVCPALAQVAIIIDRAVTTHSFVHDAVADVINQERDAAPLPSRLIHVPTLYNDPWSAEAAKVHGVELNLITVARENDMTVEEVVAAHHSVDYWSALVGFTPGAHDGIPLDPFEAISASKYKTPRTDTPARAVALAGTASTIYPLASPGGYQLIGRAAIDIYMPRPWSPAVPDGVLIRAGDRIRYRPVDRDEYDRIREATAAERYDFEIEDEVFDPSAALAAYAQVEAAHADADAGSGD